MKTPDKANSSDQSIPFKGIMLLIVVCFLWGGNIVTIKVSNQDVPPILAATIRSALAAILVWGYAKSKRERVFFPLKDLKHAIAIGILFGLDFLFLYWGPAYTDASRAIIFLYTVPIWTVLGAHYFIPGDRLNWSKIAGLSLSFLGMIAVFGARSTTLGPLYWVGDLMEVAAAVFWAATTIYIKKFIWNRSINHYQTLFAQLIFSVPILAVAAIVFEWRKPIDFNGTMLACLGYQTVLVAFFSYVLWFWMIHHFQVSRLAAFTFLAPLFGVLMSGVFLGEYLTVRLLMGLVLVAAGIYLVNRPSNQNT